jgi:ribosomal protein S27AE
MIVGEIPLQEERKCPKCGGMLVAQESVTGGVARIRLLCTRDHFVGPWSVDEKQAWELFEHSLHVRGVA